ncbi:MAG TPA: metalloregulator ArsR/SmtB family transcription factor [Actinomycetota bacterium]|nr:metalloregulator ArsR/SmtB family transcription factor [Actinomycetota bacterium]
MISARSTCAGRLRRVAIPRPIYQVRAELFRTLAHPARIQVLELLRDGEHTVGELITGVGLEPSHLSQHLGTLRRANIVQSRKKGSSVLYKVSDPRVFDLLEVAKDVIAGSLSEARELLAALQQPELSQATPASQPPAEPQ